MSTRQRVAFGVRPLAETSCIGRGLLMGLSASILACSKSAPADDPVTVAKEFISRSRAGRCVDAFALYTRPSQSVLEDRSRQLLKDLPAKHLPDFGPKFAADHLSCDTYARMRPGTAREASRHGDSAVVAVIMRTGSYIPLPFFSDPIKDHPATLRMAREDGRWKVSIEPPRTDRQRREREIGKFDVTYSREPNNPHRLFQASGTIDARSADIETVLLDFDRWSSWWPHLAESRALTGSDTSRRRRLYGRFALGADSAVDYVFEWITSTRTRDGEHQMFSASWRSTPDTIHNSPNTVRLSSWLATLSVRTVHPDSGVLVTLNYSGRPSEWPTALGAKVFRPEYGTEVLAALERAARARRRDPHPSKASRAPTR
jgi:hypothetical protein